MKPARNCRINSSQLLHLIFSNNLSCHITHNSQHDRLIPIDSLIIFTLPWSHLIMLWSLSTINFFLYFNLGNRSRSIERILHPCMCLWFVILILNVVNSDGRVSAHACANNVIDVQYLIMDVGSFPIFNGLWYSNDFK